jgi:CHAD domain-containing protein
MNSQSRGRREMEVSAEKPESHTRLAEWRQLLERCGRKPTRKRVHSLRVVTLRIQAELEHWLSAHRQDVHGAHAVTRWGKHAEKLREALSPVREADVWIGKLAELRRSLMGTEVYVPRSSRDCLRQIDNLEEQLKRERRAWEKKLVDEIADRRGRLEKFSRNIEGSIDGADAEESGGSEHILAQFAEVAAAFPTLESENLHEFRKSIKTVRYLAEIFAVSDPEAGGLAALLKKMQSAIGEWHDWQELAKKARDAHGRRSKHAELAEMLETLTAESFEKAIDVCYRLTERLLKQAGQSADPARSRDGKLPVRDVAPVYPADERRFA